MNDVRILVMGESNSGKSTIAEAIRRALLEAGISVELIDTEVHPVIWSFLQKNRFTSLKERNTKAFIHVVQTQVRK